MTRPVVPSAARNPTSRSAHPKERHWREVLTWMSGNLRASLVTAFVVIVAITAWREFRTINFHQLRATLRHLSTPWLAGAAALTVVNIAGMGLYDVIALGSATQDPPRRVRWKIGSRQMRDMKGGIEFEPGKNPNFIEYCGLCGR